MTTIEAMDQHAASLEERIIEARDGATRKAAMACAAYEFWAAEVKRLTEEIKTMMCPWEEYVIVDGEALLVGGKSCFTLASEQEIPVGVTEPYGEPETTRRTLDEIAHSVRHCPSCSRLCELIRQRKHARQRFGVAKRAVRHAGKGLIDANGLAEEWREVQDRLVEAEGGREP